MSIDKRGDQDGQINDFPASQPEAHSQIALEQAALYAARVAIARWSNSSSDLTSPLTLPQSTSSKASWYAQAQQNFQEWLGCGGFAQYDICCTEEPRSTANAPAQDAAAKRLAGGGAHRAKICAN